MASGRPSRCLSCGGSEFQTEEGVLPAPRMFTRMPSVWNSLEVRHHVCAACGFVMTYTV